MPDPLDVYYLCAGCGEWIDLSEIEDGDGHMVGRLGGHESGFRGMCGPVEAVTAVELAEMLMGDER